MEIEALVLSCFFIKRVHCERNKKRDLFKTGIYFFFLETSFYLLTFYPTVKFKNEK